MCKKISQFRKGLIFSDTWKRVRGHYFATNLTSSVDMASFRSAWPRLIWRLQAWTVGVSRLCSKALQGYSRGWKKYVRFVIADCCAPLFYWVLFITDRQLQGHSTTKVRNCFNLPDTLSVEMASFSFVRPRPAWKLQGRTVGVLKWCGKALEAYLRDQEQVSVRNKHEAQGAN